MSASTVVQAGKLNISFHGAPIGPNTARHLQSLCPYIDVEAVRAAVHGFEGVSSALNDQTKIALLVHAASKHHMRGSDTAVGAIAGLVRCLGAGLVFKDIPADSQLTKEFLVGGRTKAGFAQIFFKRSGFVEFVRVFALSSHGPGEVQG